MLNTSTPTTFEGVHASYTLDQGILIIDVNLEIPMNLEIAKQVVSERLRFTNNIAYPVLMRYHKFKLGDKESRDYMSTHGIRGVAAGAFVTKSMIIKNFFNFFINLKKPAVPSKIFSSDEEALRWLQQFKNENHLGRISVA